MLEFLLALLTTATVGVLLVPLLRQRSVAVPRLDNDLAIYRDQLAELEREQAAGTLPDAEAKAARTEIERRILVAADLAAAEGEAAPKNTATLHRFLPPALCLAVPLVALGLYLQIGRPGLPASPFARHATAPAPQQDDFSAQIAAIKKQAAEHPDDPEALSALGEALTIEAQGVVTRPAVEAFTKALKLQPGDPRAAFYLGLHEQQSGDSPAALKRWRALEAQSPPDAPWLPTLRAEIAKAGGTPAPTTAAPGMPQPNQDQVEAMSRLSPEERQKTIRAMVEGLAAKMQDTPNDRDGWLRLANARKVLGDHAQAADALARADALSPLDGAGLKEWAEAEVRQIPPGAAPPARAVAVLQRLERQEPNNALALFYLGAASFAEGDKPAAVKRWRTLLALLPPDAPIRGMLEQKVKEAE
ncbi:MAG: c-type cytochrome biogenesis protein CcmI [Enhydrobacter sp.]